MRDQRSEAAKRDDARTMRVTATVPAWAVRFADTVAAEAGITRGDLIRRAVIHLLYDAATARGLVILDSAGDPRADLYQREPVIGEDRFTAQLDSLLRGSRGLIAMPSDPPDTG